MANGMDCKSAECQLSVDQLFELAWIAVFFKLRVSICEKEVLLPPPLGFHGGWQKLLSDFLISIFLLFWVRSSFRAASAQLTAHTFTAPHTLELANGTSR